MAASWGPFTADADSRIFNILTVQNGYEMGMEHTAEWLSARPAAWLPRGGRPMEE